MKTYLVTYYLGNCYHTCLVNANNEAEAILKELNRVLDGSKAILHDFKIERYYEEWN